MKDHELHAFWEEEKVGNKKPTSTHCKTKKNLKTARTNPGTAERERLTETLSLQSADPLYKAGSR